jgi:WD40 repeat protein
MPALTVSKSSPRPKNYLALGLGLTALVMMSVTGACFEGGANMNEQTPGSGDDGVVLALGDIAIHPDGGHLLARMGDTLVRAEIETGATKTLPGMPEPERVAFDPTSDRIFVTSRTTKGDQIIAYDSASNTTNWSVATEISSPGSDSVLWGHWMPRIAPTFDGELLVATHVDRVEVFEASSGALIHELAFDQTIQDVDFSPDGHTAYLTLLHEWTGEGDEPETRLITVDLDAGTTTTLSVPNCSSELMIAEMAQVGFIAPTTCSKDPVSVIDLSTGEFVKNLPGFGPVALPVRSTVAVAFADTTNLDMELFAEGDPVPSIEDGRYHLMFIDVDTLAFDFLPVGDELPRFAMAPEGDLLLVDADNGWFGEFESEQVRLLHVESRELITIDGPDVELDHFAWTPDGDDVWLIDRGLFQIDVPAREVEERPLSFDPQNLNMSPDGSRLIVREDSSSLWVYDTQQFEEMHEIKFDTSDLAGG